MTADHYATLGVKPTANAADLRAAYLDLARNNHPDMFTGRDREHAEQRMQEINEAWNVLGVKHKRREYDAIRPKSTPGSSSADGGPRRGHAHFRPFDDDPIDRYDIDLDPRPIPGSKPLPRWMAMMPVGLVAFAIVTMAFGTMLNANSVLALGIVSLVLGGVCFLGLPLFVMSRAEKDRDL